MKNKVKKISSNIYEIKQEENMNTPVRIFASKKIFDNIKDNSIQQIKNIASLPGIQKYPITMPDIHQGYGFPIGGVGAFDLKTGIITPSGIGFDINCGVRLLLTNLNINDLRPSIITNLLESINKYIEIGINSQSKETLSLRELDEILLNGLNAMLKKGFALKDDINNCEENGCMNVETSKVVSQKAKARGQKHLGTLGSGNHFIDILSVDEIFDKKIASVYSLKKYQIVIMIHTGSRGLGHQIAKDYIEKIKQINTKNKIKNIDKDLLYVPINSKIGQDYFNAMKCASNFAWSNRQMITYYIRKVFKEYFPQSKLDLLYDLSHNIAKIETHKIDDKEIELCVHRKGATRAFPPFHNQIPQKYKEVGQPIILPGSMGTNSYVLAGQKDSMKKTFGSCAHGAGRSCSRSQAQQIFNFREIQKDITSKNITILKSNKKLLIQEGPLAYKNIDDVLNVITQENIAQLVAKLKVIGVIQS